MPSIVEQLRAAAIQKGREKIALIAEKNGEQIFAREVRAGCWDHRNDVGRAIDRAIADAEQSEVQDA